MINWIKFRGVVNMSDMPYSCVKREPLKPYIAEDRFQQRMKDIRIEAADWKDWDGEWALWQAFETIDRIEVCITYEKEKIGKYHMDRFSGEYYLFSCIDGEDLFSGYNLTHSQRIALWEKIMEHPQFRLLWICGEI